MIAPHQQLTKRNLLRLVMVLGLPILTTFGLTSYVQSQSSVDNSQRYRQALYVLWNEVYPQGKTLYCDVPFDNRRRRAAENGLNAEHVFPVSWMLKPLNCQSRKQCQASSADFREMEADLHNIYPAQAEINRARSNFRFAEVSGEKRVFGACDFEINSKARIAEPNSNRRGEIARAMLYMAYQYDLTLFAKNKTQLLEWDQADPPDTEERRREKIIRRAQGRENPFVTRYPFRDFRGSPLQ